MAIEVTKINPKRIKPVLDSFWLYENDSQTDAGTFNSRACGTATTSVLSDRWFFRTFPDVNSAFGSAVYNFKLPKDYKAGTNLQIRFIWTNNSSTTNLFSNTVGLAKKTSANVYGGEADTEYQEFVESSNGTSSFSSQLSATKTYNGSSLSAGDRCCLISYRDSDSTGGDSNPNDTLTVSCYPYAFEIIYEKDVVESGADSKTEFISRDEIAQKLKVEEWRARKLYSDTVGTPNGTFNSLSSTGRAVTAYLDRFVGAPLANAAINHHTLLWIPSKRMVADSPITLEFDIIPEGTSGGNVRLHIGFCTDTQGNDFGDETDTTYDVNQYAMSSVADTKTTVSVTFSNTGVTYLDPCVFIIVREGNHANDTNTDQIRIMGGKIKYNIDSYGSPN